MRDAGRHRGIRSATARRAAALTVVAGLVAACSTQETSDRSASAPDTPSESPTSSAPATEPTTATPAASAAESPSALPAVPSTGDAAAVAEELESAVGTLRDPDARAVAVRGAGELHQLAVRAVAASPRQIRQEVMDRLDPEMVRLVRPPVRAAGRLHSLTEPQPKLPRWRIVEPPPAQQLRDHYRAAQRRTGVPWTYLAAIHLVETRMGRIRGTSTAGAEGPMQFLPSTWEMYGGGGDIDDPADAVLAAARLLKANGAPGDMRNALWHYNPSDHYVSAVSAYARTMQRDPALYRGYWHWRVLYRHERGTYVLPVGYPDAAAERLPERGGRR